MAQRKQWQDFESRVREIATYIWSRPCVPENIAGVDIDGVVKPRNDQYILVEITLERNLDKVRSDLIKLNTAKQHLFQRGIYAHCFCIINGQVTNAMKGAAESSQSRVISIEDFTTHFFDFPAYSAARSMSAFGSAVNTTTGDPDRIEYVQVKYIEEPGQREITPQDIANMLRAGRNIVLLGEYGSGKSRCVQEVFRLLAKSASEDFFHPLAIDLRRSWGLEEADEIIRRHLNVLGLSELADASIRAFNARALTLLLDGFDEMGSQAWSNDIDKLRRIRAASVVGIKDIVTQNGGGVLVAGREHYFTSDSEMFQALGMDPQRTVVVRSKSEFDQYELAQYFERVNVDVDLPSWLPRRPLICQIIGTLDPDSLDTMFSDSESQVGFWTVFMNELCKRDARIHPSFDPGTIYQIYLALARLTRSKPTNVGPISLSELQVAFEMATGAAPVEQASVMLQRLPSLGRVGPDTDDRRFVDVYILDGLRAKDIATSAIGAEEARERMADEVWANPLDDLGQRVLAAETSLSDNGKLSLAKLALSKKNRLLAGDVVSSLCRSAPDMIDFSGLSLTKVDLKLLVLNERALKNLTVQDCAFEDLVLPVMDARQVVFRDCVASRVHGVSSVAGLPSWLSLIEVGGYDEVSNIARIREIGLSPAQEILVAIIRKTFFQTGSGRKEDALTRGLGRIASKSLVSKVLGVLMREGVLDTFKGNEGLVYTPVRAHTSRVSRIMQELAGSKDAIWADVSAL